MVNKFLLLKRSVMSVYRIDPNLDNVIKVRSLLGHTV